MFNDTTSEPDLVAKLPLTALLVAALLSPIGAAYASGPESGVWRGSVSGGSTVAISGGALHDGVGEIPNLGIFDPGLTGNVGVVTLDSKSYQSLFGTGWNFGAELSLGESDSLESYARLSRESLPGHSMVVTGQIAPTGATEGSVLSAGFGDLNSWRLSVGQRYFFLPGHNLRPFVSGGLGLNYTDAVHAAFSAPDIGGSVVTSRYFRSTTGFLGEVGVGMEYGLTPALGLNVGVSADYLAGARADGVALSAAGLPVLTSTNGHWSVPARVGLVYRF